MSILEHISSPDDLKGFSILQLESLADEIRDYIIQTVELNGGHLASALGVVDLSVAVHYLFDSPIDKIIFDVGHQSYAHKLLTGRYERFKTLRALNGEFGFTKAASSPHDVFISGHASTSISVACGQMRAKALSGKDYNIVSIIGDGSMSGGMIHEALNDLINIEGNQIIIINDNNMSIDKSVGSIANSLAKMHTKRWYSELKTYTREKLKKNPRNRTIRRLRILKNTVKYFIQGSLPFDDYGVKYFGPVDGHDMKQLIRYLSIAKNYRKTVIVHISTTKGYGHQFAMDEPSNYHGLSAKGEKFVGNTFSKQAGQSLINIARKDEKVIAVTCAMKDGCGLSAYSEEFPDRFYDVGIAEQHAATMCASLASAGYKPYYAVYSTFLQRAFDQILHDVCIEQQNVTFLVDRSGIVGRDGETHQGTFDISYLNLIPNMTILSPMNLDELNLMIEWSLSYDKPLAIRYPRGGSLLTIKAEPVKYAKWTKLLDYDSEVVVIATGAKMVENAYKACENTNTTLFNARFLKPYDTEVLDSLIGKKIITIEDNVINGGLFSIISSYYASRGINQIIKPLAVKDIFVPQGSMQELFKILKLDTYNIQLAIDNF